MKTLSTLWLAFWYWRQLQPFLARLLEAVGNKDFPAALREIGNFINVITPPAPTGDSAGVIPENLERRQRWQFGRIMNRLRVARSMTDGEVRIACTHHKITPCELEDKQWT